MPIKYAHGGRRKGGDAWKHKIPLGRTLIDPFSSAVWFDHYADTDPSTRRRLHTEQRLHRTRHGPDPCATTRGWLFDNGWKRNHHLSVHDLPRSDAASKAWTNTSGAPADTTTASRRRPA